MGKVIVVLLALAGSAAAHEQHIPFFGQYRYGGPGVGMVYVPSGAVPVYNYPRPRTYYEFRPLLPAPAFEYQYNYNYRYRYRDPVESYWNSW